mgnify:CR=1 FL=1
MCTILFTHIKVVVLSGLAWFKQTSVIYDWLIEAHSAHASRAVMKNEAILFRSEGFSFM